MADAALLMQLPNSFQICADHIRLAFEPSNISTELVRSSLPGLVAPSSIWTFLSDDKTWMIRQEYHDAIIAIIGWVSCARRAVGYTAELDHIVFTPTETLQKKSDEYPNPFKGNETVNCSDGSLVVIGLPGIGKSVFLKYVWTIRTMLNLPTLYASSEKAYVWADNHLFQIMPSLSQTEAVTLRKFLPAETWCLIDSNQTLETVPTCISESGRFFMQAASPRDFRLNWRDKVKISPVFFVMQEWSLSELLQGDRLLVSPFLLKEYNDEYGGSARDAYAKSGNLAKFRATLQQAALNISYDCLVNPMEAVEPRTDDFITIDPKSSHHFLSVFPASDHDRAQFIIRPPSKKVLNIVVQSVTKRMQASEVDLFHRLLANKGVLSERSVAAYFYNGNFPQYLIRARSLRCYPMTTDALPTPGQRTRSWVTDANASQSIRLANVPVQYFNSSAPPTEWTVGTLYVPNVMNFATMDAFLVRSASHVVMYQASIVNRHDFTIEGLNWLAKRGFESAEYAYISPSTVSVASVSLPASIPASLKYKDFTGVLSEILFPQQTNDMTGYDLDRILEDSTSTLPIKVLRVYHVILDFKETQAEEGPVSKKAKLS